MARQTLSCREALERYGPEPEERVELWGDSLPVHDGAFLHSAFGGCFMTVLHGAVTTGEGRRFDLWTQPGHGNVALSVAKWDSISISVEERDAIQARGTSCFGLCVSPVAPALSPEKCQETRRETLFQATAGNNARACGDRSAPVR